MADNDLTLDGNIARTFSVAQDRTEGLGLPRDFLASIMSQDDWSCVLKLQAVLDAAIEASILDHCFAAGVSIRDRNEVALGKMVARLNFDGPVSKLAFAHSFNLLDEQTISFVRALNRMRNAYAHRLELVSLPVLDAAKVMDQSGDLLAKLFAGFPFEADIDAIAWRLALVIKGATALWQLEVRTMDPPRWMTGPGENYYRLFGRPDDQEPKSEVDEGTA